MEPTPAYFEFFPFDRDIVARLAYYFHHGYASHPDPNSYIGPMAAAVKRWHAEVGRSAFVSVDRLDTLRLIDTRPVATEPKAVLRGLERDVFRACAHGATLEAIVRLLGRTPVEIQGVLDSFLERRWALCLDDKFLSLAVPMDRHVRSYVPVSMVEDGLLETYRARMARIHQGFTPAVPSFDRLRATTAASRDRRAVPA